MTARKKSGQAVVYIDGASRGNPGPAACGAVFQDDTGKTLKTLSVAIGQATNNTAEYCALILALQEAILLGIRELRVYSDSELLVRQWSGEYRVKEDSLKVLALLARQLYRFFGRLEVAHVPREKNTLADREANRALDAGHLF